MDEKTLFELRPDRFVMPGRVKRKPLPDLVFERDPTAPGLLYRAKLEPADFGLEEREVPIKPDIP